MEANTNVKGSPYIEGRIKEIKSQEGKKNKIDTKNEYEALQELLNGGLSKSDRDLIEAEMKKYEELSLKQKAKEAADKVAKPIRDFVKEIAKKFGDKKEIDTLEEAKAIRNQMDDPTIGDADREYLANVLRERGYGSLIEGEGSSADAKTGPVNSMKPPVNATEDKQPTQESEQTPVNSTNPPANVIEDNEPTQESTQTPVNSEKPPINTTEDKDAKQKPVQKSNQKSSRKTSPNVKDLTPMIDDMFKKWNKRFPYKV